MKFNGGCKYCCSFVLLLLFPAFVIAAGGKPSAAEEHCSKLLSDQEIEQLFKQNALNQLALEFGKEGSFVYEITRFPVDDVLVNMESYARYQKPGQKDLARMRLKGWISRCNGTTIIRGNTWLANGTLKVLRYSAQELEGRGFIWGDKNAPMKFIVYVDSRCPHCHRLIEYAKSLVKQGKVMLDIRQVAYLEKEQEAIQDTLLSNTSLVSGNPTVNDKSYLEMLGGNNSVEELDDKSPEYKKALDLIKQNTATAEQFLHIITVPGILIQEEAHNNRYRKMGYWEINRIFQ